MGTLVSIVTTCWNRAATVGNSIHSVMSQTYPDIEHIVVDGASTDGTLDAIKACGSTRIAKLISERDHGCYEALNKGIKASTGQIVGWLHSDDVFSNPEVIAKVVDCFEKYDCDMVYANGRFVSPSNHDWVIRDWVSGTFTEEKMRNGWLPLHTTVFVKRSVFDRFGYYREDYRIAGDTFWLLTCMYKTGIKTHYLDECVVEMEYGGLSTSWSRTFHRWREDLGIYYQIGISPRQALLKKVLRKIPQFVMAPFRSKPQ